MRDHSQVFGEIYAKEKWGKGKGSGTGSDPNYCSKYLQRLREFIEEKQITSVLDLGCGDRQLYVDFDWGGVEYLGVDVVESVSPDLVWDFQNDVKGLFVSPWSWDLVLIKDVLMHWTNEEIKEFMNSFTMQPFQYAWITNSWRYNRLPEKNKLPRELDPRYSWAPVDVNKEPMLGYGVEEYFRFKFKQVGIIRRGP